MVLSRFKRSSGRGQALPALAKNNSPDCFLYASRQVSYTPEASGILDYLRLIVN